jgi:glutathione-regulated potassium-efflux system ancillary protein KefC
MHGYCLPSGWVSLCCNIACDLVSRRNRAFRDHRRHRGAAHHRRFLGSGGLLASTQWITFLAGTGAIVLTFLAGAELEPTIFKTKWKEAVLVGLAGFIGPFLGCTLVGHYILGWSMRSSWLCGVALSTTSVAVVYAVMLELGLNVTDFGKAILAACFVNDLGTVIALGLDLLALHL